MVNANFGCCCMFRDSMNYEENPFRSIVCWQGTELEVSIAPKYKFLLKNIKKFPDFYLKPHLDLKE